MEGAKGGEEKGPSTNTDTTQGTNQITEDAFDSNMNPPPAEQQRADSQALPSSARCANCSASSTSTSHLLRCTSGREMCVTCSQGLRDCKGCYDLIDVGDAISTHRVCNCTYCLPCFNRFWRSALKARKGYPPRCCDIGQGLNMDGKESFLDQEVLDTYRERDAEWRATEPIYCASETCGKFLRDRWVGMDFNGAATCNDCNVDTCMRCRQLMSSHMNNTCPPDTTIVTDKTLEPGDWPVHRCPNCRALVTKHEDYGGCDDLTCAFCKTQLCADCGKNLEECVHRDPWPEDIDEDSDEEAEEEEGDDDEDEEKEHDEDTAGDDEEAAGNGQDAAENGGVVARTDEDAKGSDEDVEGVAAADAIDQ